MNSGDITQRGYNLPARVLHWLMALLIIGAFTVGVVMTEMPFSPQRLKVYNYHKWVGVTVLALAALRLLWRLFSPPPPALPMPSWQKFVAHALHILLYVAMFAVPLTGWIYSNYSGYPIVYFGVMPLPNLVETNREIARSWHEIHEIAAYVLAAMVALHMAAALKHHFIDRDDTLRRMLRSQPAKS